VRGQCTAHPCCLFLLCACTCAWQYTAGSPGYTALAKEVQAWENQPTCPAGRLFYLALPPYVYPEVSSSNVGVGNESAQWDWVGHSPLCRV